MNDLEKIKKPTKTNRFNRLFDKCFKNLGDRRLWDHADLLVGNKPDLKYFYELGYEQGKRDLSRELKK